MISLTDANVGVLIIGFQVVLPEKTKYDTFVIPDCPVCLQENRVNDMLKPEVIFFGESIPASVKDRS